MLHPSELVLNKDQSVYHLKLRPEHLADKIIIAGDPHRIATISSRFDSIEHRIENREFITHTGYYKGCRVSAIATGIGTDNIDIVLNELDALVNIDLEKREVKEELSSLEIVRIGTCGSIQEEVLADEIVVSSHAIGLDGLMNFYDFEMNEEETRLFKLFKTQSNWKEILNKPYLVEGSKDLVERIGEGFHKGITITANGFYAPQGRKLRLKPRHENVNEDLRACDLEGKKILNYEMETSALYGLSKLMGHRACTVCAVVANRYANSFSKDYKPVISQLIDTVLERLTKDRG
jgi:uridine phosphorylase